MHEKFEAWLHQPDLLATRLKSASSSQERDAVSHELVEFVAYAGRQVQFLRQRLNKALRNTFASKSEGVGESELLFSMLSLLIGEGWQPVPAADTVAELVGVPDPRCESVGRASDSDCSTSCVALDDRWFCAQGSDWQKRAISCHCVRRAPRPRKRGERKPLDLGALPCLERFHKADDTDGSTFLRYQTTETIEYQPACAYRLRTHREVRVRATPEEGKPDVFIGPGPCNPFPGCKLGPSLMAHLVISRVDMGCPTYRKLGEFESFGLRLPESTVRDAYSRVDTYLAGLHPLFRSDLVACHLVSVDDTRLITLDPEASGNKFTSRIWTFIGDQNKVIYFDVTKTWKASDFADLLPEFHAKVLQGDGYAGYAFFLQPWLDVIQAGCLDHARRKVYDAYIFEDPDAAWLLERIQRIYRIEADARAAGADLNELHRRRQTFAVPIFADVYKFLATLRTRLVRGSYLHRAVTYLTRQKAALLAYLDDPRIPISNVHVERLIKKVAMVRKNSQICGSFEGAQRLARYMTLVGNCKLAGINPQHYLTDVLTRCGHGWPSTKLHELLPRVWQPVTPLVGLPAHSEQIFWH